MSEDPGKDRASSGSGDEELGEKAFFADGPDEELAALPPPPRRRGRNPWFMAIVVVLSILILWWFRFEVLYFFSSSQPVDLGRAADLDPEDLPSNAYVTVEAWPNPTRGVKFQRKLRKTFYRVRPTVGQKKLFLLNEILPAELEQSSSEVSQLEGRFTGRLISFGDLESTFLTRSGYKKVRLFFREELFVEITNDCFLLFDGVTPRSYWWYLLLALIVTGVGVANAVLLVRTLSKRLRERQPSA